MIFLKWWRSHGTGILGTCSSIVGTALTIPDLINPARVKYWAFAGAILGILTIKRSHTNRKVLKETQA